MVTYKYVKREKQEWGPVRAAGTENASIPASWFVVKSKANMAHPPSLKSAYDIEFE